MDGDIQTLKKNVKLMLLIENIKGVIESVECHHVTISETLDEI